MSGRLLCKKSVLGGGLGACPFVHCAMMAMIKKGITYEVQLEDLMNKSEELLRLSPNGTVPVYVSPCGEVTTESMDIVTKVAGLEPPKPEVQQSLEKAFPSLIKFLTTSGEEVLAAEANLRAVLEGIHPVVPTTPPLSSDDCVLGTRLHTIFVASKGMKGKDWASEFPSLASYLERLKQTPEWEQAKYPDEEITEGWRIKMQALQKAGKL